jgi:flavin-dependent dehydrogenase
MFDTDVFVLGGGPAGLAAAVAASRKGFRVLLADAARPPIDKACGEGLMPDSLAAARGIGISIPVECGHPIRGIRFVGPSHSVVAAFPDGAGLGVRRTVLHRVLVGEAARASVGMRWGVTVTGIDDSGLVRVGADRIRARWIIGADGGQSSVRRWAGLQEFRRETQRFGFRRHYRVAPWSDSMEIHWGRGCQFYVTPVSKREICLVLMSRDRRLRPDEALPQFPNLVERLAGAEIVTPERGSLAATCRLERVTRGNVALIGDASGTVDAITGEGLCLAFQQAIVLADALAAGGLTRYEVAHRRVSRRPVFMADFMLMMDRWAWIRQRALAALSSRPELFADLLAMHVGKLSLSRFAATAATLGWKVATA